MKTRILLILISFLSFACEDELLKNKPRLMKGYENYPKYETLKLTGEILNYSYYSKDSSYSLYKNIPDSSAILEMVVSIKNVTSKTISFVTMSCSYYSDFETKTEGAFISALPCFANFPETIEILPESSKNWRIQVIISKPFVSKTKNIELCFQPKREFSKINENIYSICSETIKIGK